MQAKDVSILLQQNQKMHRTQRLEEFIHFAEYVQKHLRNLEEYMMRPLYQ